MGEDAEREQRLERSGGLPGLVRDHGRRLARRGVHALPAGAPREEVTAEVIDGPRSVVFQQAANRLPTEQALIHTLIERWR